MEDINKNVAERYATPMEVECMLLESYNAWSLMPASHARQELYQCFSRWNLFLSLKGFSVAWIDSILKRFYVTFIVVSSRLLSSGRDYYSRADVMHPVWQLHPGTLVQVRCLGNEHVRLKHPATLAEGKVLDRSILASGAVWVLVSLTFDDLVFADATKVEPGDDPEWSLWVDMSYVDILQGASERDAGTAEVRDKLHHVVRILETNSGVWS